MTHDDKGLAGRFHPITDRTLRRLSDIHLETFTTGIDGRIPSGVRKPFMSNPGSALAE